MSLPRALEKLDDRAMQPLPPHKLTIGIFSEMADEADVELFDDNTIFLDLNITSIPQTPPSHMGSVDIRSIKGSRKKRLGARIEEDAQVERFNQTLLELDGKMFDDNDDQNNATSNNHSPNSSRLVSPQTPNPISSTPFQNQKRESNQNTPDQITPDANSNNNTPKSTSNKTTPQPQAMTPKHKSSLLSPFLPKLPQSTSKSIPSHDFPAIPSNSDDLTIDNRHDDDILIQEGSHSQQNSAKNTTNFQN